MAFMDVGDAKAREQQKHERLSWKGVAMKYWRDSAAASEAQSVHKRKPRLRTETYEWLATTSS